MSSPRRHERRCLSRRTYTIIRAGAAGLICAAFGAGPANAASGGVARNHGSGALAAVVVVGSLLIVVGLAGALSLVADRRRLRRGDGQMRLAGATSIGGTAVKRAASSGAGTTARVVATTGRISSAGLRGAASRVGNLSWRAGQAGADHDGTAAREAARAERERQYREWSEGRHAGRAGADQNGKVEYAGADQATREEPKRI